MNVHAWKLWARRRSAGRGDAARSRSGSSRCCSAVPGHPGANHYYIHVMEGLADPGRALASAERLRGMMPARDIWSPCPLTSCSASGVTRMRLRRTAAEWRPMRRTFRATSAPDYYRMYLAHNYAFLAFSAPWRTQGRRHSRGAERAADHPLDMMLAMGDSGWSLTQQYARWCASDCGTRWIAQLAPIRGPAVSRPVISMAAAWRSPRVAGSLRRRVRWPLQQLGGTVCGGCRGGIQHVAGPC